MTKVSTSTSTSSSSDAMKKLLEAFEKVTIFNNAKIGTFHGQEDEDAKGWMDQYIMMADVNQWDEEEKMRNLPFHLGDDARSWYKIYVQDSVNRKELDTFQKVMQLFLSDFQPLEQKEFERKK